MYNYFAYVKVEGAKREVGRVTMGGWVKRGRHVHTHIPVPDES